ncbi:MAG: hypothetical protein A2Z16_07365 [Chloroflexi bacterium RBG_16_54_18]|nr:MAG: hypothetical protein A2Z16_07365 [Chloroflexi bacterium RBG_16_54_18]
MKLLQRSRRSPIASPEEFRALYEHNRTSVFRYIFSLTGGPQEEVEDLTADTFLRAWKARHTFDGANGAATGWLIQIAKRLVIDQYRRDTVQNKQLDAHFQEMDPSPEQAAIAGEEGRLLLSLLAELPDEAREIIVLRYILGWRVADIAVHLGATDNSVSVSIHRTLTRLQDKWQAAENAGIRAAFVQEEKFS